jgi:hypothetical protein
MHKKVITIVFLLVAATASATFSYLPEYLSAKMNKHLRKIFKTEVVSTELPIADSLDLNHQLFELTDIDSNNLGYSIITKALGCNIGGCDNPNKKSNSFEQFYFMTAFNAEKQIEKVRVLEYTSDHGYQIANKSWLKQFENKQNFEVGKNIDAISGATISVNSITKAVNKQVTILSQLK